MNVQPLRRRITRRLPTLWIACLLVLASCSTALAAANTSSAHHHKKPKSKLAGEWKGSYSGAFSGHFTIHWTQKGRKLSGTIKLSNPKGRYGIDGSIRAHKKLKFGAVTVGAKYKGVWNGGSTMSGTWTSPQGGGSWSAHKA